MRNFVLFLNYCVFAAGLYNYSFFTIIMDGQAKNKGISDDDLFYLKANMAGVGLVSLVGVAFQPLLVVAVPYALKIMQTYNKMFYDKTVALEAYNFLFMLVTSVVLCLALPLSGMYLTLNFQGFTRKEKKVVEDTQGKKIASVNMLKGIKNLIKFYFEWEHVASEFDKFVGANSEEEIEL